MTWIEHVASPLPRECSTTELHGQNPLPESCDTGAGDEVRTRDILLGRQVLYQLSYTRTLFPPISIKSIEINVLQNFLVEGEGFEPSKAEPTDLQSVPFDRSGTPPVKR